MKVHDNRFLLVQIVLLENYGGLYLEFHFVITAGRCMGRKTFCNIDYESSLYLSAEG